MTQCCISFSYAGIFAPGPSSSNPSRIINCKFLNFANLASFKGVAVELSASGSPDSDNWEITNSRFEQSKQGIFINNNDNIKITNNYFTRCATVQQGMRLASSSCCLV